MPRNVSQFNTYGLLPWLSYDQPHGSCDDLVFHTSTCFEGMWAYIRFGPHADSFLLVLHLFSQTYSKWWHPLAELYRYKTVYNICMRIWMPTNRPTYIPDVPTYLPPCVHTKTYLQKLFTYSILSILCTWYTYFLIYLCTYTTIPTWWNITMNKYDIWYWYMIIIYICNFLTTLWMMMVMMMMIDDGCSMIDAWRPMIDDRRGHEDYEGPEGNEGSEGKVEERLVAGWRWKNNRSAGLTIELMIGLGCKQN